MNHKWVNDCIGLFRVMKSLSKASVLFCGIFCFTTTHLSAQIEAAPPAPAVTLRSGPELDTLVGPIALYPDPLVAQVLPAATVPEQIVMAQRFIDAGNDINLVDQQPWDPSVKAVCRYPDVLKMLDSNLAWTTQLGQAFLYQPQDVMNAIQRLRSQALSLGNLQSTPEQQVVSDAGVIEVLPADPAVIYVPIYEPGIVFFRRRPANGFYISFGHGFRIGGWLNHDVDWFHHNLIVWGRGHERPAGWWREPPHERFGDVRVVNNYHVWQPRAHEIHGDRGWDIHPERRPVASPPRAVGRPEVRPVIPPRVVEPPHPASGALIGIDSRHNTEQFSHRGEQSRQINRPASNPAPRAVPAAPHQSPSGEHQRERK